jgi:hypothetical protein
MTTFDWFKNRHDTLIDDLEPLQVGSRRLMEFDGSEWRDITPKLIRETRKRIEEMELLVRIYELRNENPPNLDSSSRVKESFVIFLSAGLRLTLIGQLISAGHHS